VQQRVQNVVAGGVHGCWLPETCLAARGNGSKNSLGLKIFDQASTTSLAAQGRPSGKQSSKPGICSPRSRTPLEQQPQQATSRHDQHHDHAPRR